MKKYQSHSSGFTLWFTFAVLVSALLGYSGPPTVAWVGSTLVRCLWPSFLVRDVPAIVDVIDEWAWSNWNILVTLYLR
jgi:hypothetical protein